MNSLNITNLNSTFKYLLPEIYLISMILFIFTVSVVLEKKFPYYSRKILFLNVIFSIMILLITCVILHIGIDLPIKYLEVPGNNGEEEKIQIAEAMLFNNSYRINPLTNFIKGIVTFLAMACIINSYEYIKDERNFMKYEYIQLILIATLSLFVIVSANDFVVFFMGLELQAFSLYILASIKRNKNFSTEAGLKYFIVGGVSSSFFLLGVSLIYGYSGLINYDDLYIYLSVYAEMKGSTEELYGISLGFILITISLFIKLGVAPFQFWVPDVYEGVITPMTFYLSIIPKAAIYFILFRFYYYVFVEFINIWKSFLLMGVIISLFVGSAGALYQTKIKRLMAYSGISHVGFILMGILCNGSITLSMFTVLVYIIIYGFLVTGFFLILVKLRVRNSHIKIRQISDLRGLYASNKGLSIALCLNLFSLAGIPPLSGFFSKLYILMVGMSSGFYALVLFALIISTISSFYYIRVIKEIFFFKEKKYFLLKPLTFFESLCISALTILNAVFFFWPEPIIYYVYKMVFLYSGPILFSLL